MRSTFKKVLEWVSEMLISLLGFVFEQIFNRLFRLLVGPCILTVAVVAIYPAHDDWCLEPKPGCTEQHAKSCLVDWVNCHGGSMVVDPTNPLKVTQDPIRMVQCYRQYQRKCKNCGDAKNNGGFFDRLQRYGPWWLGEGSAPYCPLRSA